MSSHNISELPTLTGDIKAMRDGIQTLDHYRLAIKDLLAEIDDRNSVDDDVAELLQMAPDATLIEGGSTDDTADDLKPVLESCMALIDKISKKYA